MEHVVAGVQRTFPKKTGTRESAFKKGAFGRAIGRKRTRRAGTQRHFNSIFFESDGDFSEDDAKVEVKRSSEKRKPRYKSNGTVLTEKSIENMTQDATNADDDEFDTWVAPVNDGFDTWIPPPPSNRKKKSKRASNRAVIFGKDEENTVQQVTDAVVDKFDIRISPANDEFDTWIPPPPNDRPFKKKKQYYYGKRTNSWKEQMSMLNGENSGTGDGTAKLKDDENKNIVTHEAQSKPSIEDDSYFDEGKTNFIGPERNTQAIGSFAHNLKEGGAVSNSTAFREEIANIPLGKAKQLQERVGTKLFDKAFFSENSTNNLSKKPVPRNFVRENPKRPREVSSKIPVSKFRNVFQNEKLENKKFDPRFDDRCGEFNDYIYRNNYSFLDEIRHQEKKILIDELKKVRHNTPERGRLKEAIRKINNQEKTQADVDRHKEVIREIRRENNERMRQGLPPVFKTRAQIRLLEWQKKFGDLKGGKKLEKYIRRKAKKRNMKRGGSVPAFGEADSSENDLTENVLNESIG